MNLRKLLGPLLVLLALLGGAPAWATALFTDNFSAADGNLSTGAWASLNGTLSRYSGVARTTNGTFTTDSIYKPTGVTLPANTYTQAKVVAFTNSSASFILAVRATVGFDAYYCQINSGVIRITKLIGGSPTVLNTSAAYTFAPNDLFKCEANGTTLTAYINGVSKVTTTDGSITAAGDAWLWINSLGTESDTVADDVEAGNLSAGAPVLSSLTPSGTLGTTTTATPAATTDTASGTFYCVGSTTNNVSTATAPQIKLGQNSTSAAAAVSANTAVSSTSASTSFSGLTANTLYYQACAQNATGGDSNVLSGTFTTAATAGLKAGRMSLLGAGR